MLEHRRREQGDPAASARMPSRPATSRASSPARKKPKPVIPELQHSHSTGRSSRRGKVALRVRPQLHAQQRKPEQQHQQQVGVCSSIGVTDLGAPVGRRQQTVTRSWPLDGSQVRLAR